VCSLRQALRRLRLKDGDIVVVRNGYDLKNLMNAARGMKNLPNCPVVVVQDSIHRLSKEYLAKLVRTAKSPADSASTVEVP